MYLFSFMLFIFLTIFLFLEKLHMQDLSWGNVALRHDYFWL
jgi:hypothetical protein